MLTYRLKLIPILLGACLLASCSRNLSSNVYTDSATAGKVLEGTIISTRSVTIKAHDKLQENAVGGLGGGVAGAVAGSQFGNGNGSTAAGVGGAILGAVAGAYIEDALSTSDGVEYLVKLDKKYVQEYTHISKKVQTSGKQSTAQDLQASTSAGSKTDIIAVVQAPDSELHVGSHVYIIYNDSHPRLTAQK